MGKKEKNRVNVKARLNRHLRIIKENIGVSNKSTLNIKKEINHQYYNIVLFCVLLIVPVYPTLASFMYNSSRIEFYRGNIDESGIIESYFGGNDDNIEELNGPILETLDSFISVNTILDDERNLEGTNEIVEYEVKPGESFYSISYKFKVSTNSIYWANDFKKKHTLQPGEIIKVPPVTGLIHQVKKGDTVSSIAKKYDTPEKKIREQNNIEELGKLIAGEVLVIPDAIKKIIKPVYKKAVKTYKKYTKKGYTYPKSGSTKYLGNKGKYKYKLVWRKPYSGAWGNCTYYVASYANVNWRGNANRWMVNAKAKGHTIEQAGSIPRPGAIVQLSGRGYNPRYGHVALVMDVVGDYMIVSEMNYRKLNEVTYRKIALNDRAIDGYIYVK